MTASNKRVKRDALSVLNYSVKGLIVRELTYRISIVKFGFGGVLLQTLGSMIVFLVVIGGLRRASTNIEPYINFLFLVPGIVLFNLFSECTIRNLNAYKANESLFYYRPVKPIDAVVARTSVEIFIHTLCYLLLIAIVSLTFEVFTVSNLPLLAILFLSLSVIGGGLGIISMTAGHMYPILLSIVPLLTRPLWFLSGVFYSLESIPQNIQPWISWNPIIQAIELSRSCILDNYILSERISLGYLLIVTLFVGFAGMSYYVAYEPKLLKR